MVWSEIIFSKGFQNICQLRRFHHITCLESEKRKWKNNTKNSFLSPWLDCYQWLPGYSRGLITWLPLLKKLCLQERIYTMWKLWIHKVKLSNINQNRGIFFKFGTKSGNFGFFTRSINLLNPLLVYMFICMWFQEILVPDWISWNPW